VLDVGRDRLGRQEQGGGELAVGAAGGDQPGDLELTSGQRGPRFGRAVPGRGGQQPAAAPLQGRPDGGLAAAGEGGRPDRAERPPAGGGGHGRQQPGLADPASPATSSRWPRPSVTAASRRSARARNSSRPIRTGDWSVRIGHLTDAVQTVVGDALAAQAAREGSPSMARFMDVHSGFVGVTEAQLLEAHRRDQAIEGEEGVHFEKAWLDPEAGKVFCLATGPSKESVLRIHERAGHPTNEIYEVPVEVE
jgi:hypothetical protein